MTEAKVSLISQNLHFKKIHRLPKSPWAQLRDRVIDVPLSAVNITEAIENNNILQCVKEVLEIYDKSEPRHEKLVEMKGKLIHDAITRILMIPEIQKHILSNKDIFKRWKKALITNGRSTKSIILKRHAKDRYMNNYYPERIFDWNGHMDLQVCLDFFRLLGTSRIIIPKMIQVQLSA